MNYEVTVTTADYNNSGKFFFNVIDCPLTTAFRRSYPGVLGAKTGTGCWSSLQDVDWSLWTALDNERAEANSKNHDHAINSIGIHRLDNPDDSHYGGFHWYPPCDWKMRKVHLWYALMRQVIPGL